MENINVLPNKPIWKQNLFVLWIGSFLNGIGFSMIMPFLSLYIDSLGHFTKGQTEFLSGLAFSATFIVMAVVSPIWGKLADQKGRKLMLLRASLGTAVSIGLMGLAPNVAVLIGLRALQGLLSGYVSNATALMATSVPRDHAGRALGTLSTGAVSGTLIGPLIGGLISNYSGFRLPFLITGGLNIVIFFLTLFLVHETFVPKEVNDRATTIQIFKKIKYPYLILGMFITTMLIQAANNSVGPLISLYAREVMHSSHNLALISGILASLPGFATLIAAPRFGQLGDRIGSHRVLVFGLILAILVYIPQGFVTNIWQLGFLRFLVGISDAALLPQVQAILAKYSPHEDAGMIFSYNQSFQSIGNFAGPLIGGVVSGSLGFPALFIVTASLMFINLGVVSTGTKALKKSTH